MRYRQIRAICFAIGLGAFVAAMLTLTLQAHAAARSAARLDDDHDLDAKGIITSAPAGTLYGTWVIGGNSYQAVAGTTEFEQEHGPLTVGQCAKVKYVLQGATRIAKEIESEDDCDGDHGEHRFVETKGIIQSFPAGLIGTWVVSGISYTATPTTSFVQFGRPFAVGVCVEIKHRANSTLALWIKTQDARECDGAGGNIAKAKGTLASFPDTLLGTWIVNSTTYQVISTTVLDRSHGDFYVGACVEVRYIASDPNRTATKVETESPDECEDDDDGVITPTRQARGIISSRPPSVTLFGEWIIGGNAYSAVPGVTTFKQEHGELIVNQCAKVLYFMQGSQRIAARISSEQLHSCNAHDEEHKFYGAISSLPDTPDLIGIWVIGGRSVLVNSSTLLKNGPFAVGMIVEVHYYRVTDGSLVATKIEAKRGSTDEKKNGKAHGILTSRPPTPTVVGTWVVASVTYSVMTDTRLVGPLNIGDCVVVHYRVDSAGNRLARKLKTESLIRCARADGEIISKTYGFVEQMPSGSFIGTWVIGGITYDARVGTKFEEKRGALAVGAYVEVYYFVQNGVNVALKIETHCPPQAGEINAIGALSFASGAQSAELANDETWLIGGQPYVVLDATMLYDAAGELSAGRRVLVNAYTDSATGAKVATYIVALGDKNVYVPAVARK